MAKFPIAHFLDVIWWLLDWKIKGGGGGNVCAVQAELWRKDWKSNSLANQPASCRHHRCGWRCAQMQPTTSGQIAQQQEATTTTDT